MADESSHYQDKRRQEGLNAPTSKASFALPIRPIVRLPPIPHKLEANAQNPEPPVAQQAGNISSTNSALSNPPLATPSSTLNPNAALASSFVPSSAQTTIAAFAPIQAPTPCHVPIPFNPELPQQGPQPIYPTIPIRAPTSFQDQASFLTAGPTRPPAPFHPPGFSHGQPPAQLRPAQQHAQLPSPRFSQRMPTRSTASQYSLMWSCCGCEDGPNGVNENHCSGCHHVRCGYCTMMWV